MVTEIIAIKMLYVSMMSTLDTSVPVRVIMMAMEHTVHVSTLVLRYWMYPVLFFIFTHGYMSGPYRIIHSTEYTVT